MGMHCCCGVKKRDGSVCECDWNGWNLCWEQDNHLHSIPVKVTVKEIPDQN